MHLPNPTEAANFVSPRHQPMRFPEFVIVIAGLLALIALATSMMLPVLAEISRTYGISVTQSQSVITAFFLAFGLGQFVVGPISDTIGRRAVLLGGLTIYIAGGVLCIFAPSFETLLAARFIQGLGGAAPRVVTISIVRDCYSGRRMANVMSLVMTVFMTVPVVAPSLGQLVVLAAPWQWIFVILTVCGVAALCWISIRLPETLRLQDRRSLQPAQILEAVKQALASRRTLGYMLAAGLTQGAMLASLYAAPQVLGELLGLGSYFPIAFGVSALAMSMGAFLNAQLVNRFGMRGLSQAAILIATGLTVAQLLLAHGNMINFVGFTAFMSAINALNIMASSNFNALAMEPQGHIAGTASSLFGSVTTLMQALIAHIIGHAYNGTIVPLAIGMLACNIAILVIIFVTERTGKSGAQHP